MYNDKQAHLEGSSTLSQTPGPSTDSQMEVDEDGEPLSNEQKDDRRMHFMIHPSVDVDMSSSQV